MFEPKYNYSDKLVKDLVKLEAGKNIIFMSNIEYETKSKLILHSKVLNLFHILNAIGLESSLKDTEKILNLGLDTEDVKLKKFINNIKNSLDFAKSEEAKSFPDFDLSILTEINKRVVISWKDTWDNKFRNFNEKFDSSFEIFESLRDVNIKANDLETQFVNLVEWYKLSKPGTAEVVRVAILVYRLLEIAPFIAGNAYTTIFLAELILYRYNLGQNAFISLFKIFLLNKKEIEETIRFCQKNYDISPWIEKFTKLLNKEVSESRLRANEFLEIQEKNSSRPFIDLNNRQMKILKYLQTIPTVRREEYCNIMEVSTMTAYRDLEELVRKKLLKIEGIGRGTKYRLANY